MGKRILRTVVVLGAILPLVGNAFACDKDHSAKADQQKAAKTASQSAPPAATNKAKDPRG
jgi:hypothetical protein